MGMSEIQRKMTYISVGPEQYESMIRRDYRSEYLERYCKNMKINLYTVRKKDPEYYEIIMASAAEATERMWAEEKKLIDKWEEQKRRICESVKMA